MSRIRFPRLSPCLLLVVSATAAPPATADNSPGPPVKTVRVDCDRGQTVSAALAHKADLLIVEIDGLCHERVLIRRSGVVLRGSDPAVDGIVGPVDVDKGLVEISGADVFGTFLLSETAEYAVTLENLQLSDNDGPGLFATGSTVRIDNCWLIDNGRTGAHFTASSAALITDTLVARNGGIGISANRAAVIACERCTLDDNAAAAAAATNSALTFVLDSTIAGLEGVRAFNGGRVVGDDTPIVAAVRALRAGGGEIRWSNSSFSGDILVSSKSSVTLIDCDQTANPGVNRIDADTTFELFGGTLLGTTRLTAFSNGQVSFGLLGPPTLGDLECFGASDIICDGSEVKASSTCSSCP